MGPDSEGSRRFFFDSIHNVGIFTLEMCRLGRDPTTRPR